MSTTSRPPHPMANRRRRWGAATWLGLACLCAPLTALQARGPLPGTPDWLSDQAPPTTFRSSPYPSSDGAFEHAPRRRPPQSDPWLRGVDRERFNTPPDDRWLHSFEPDLTGSWRGGAGEKVEIRRNRARIWGGSEQFCDCVFFLIGDRLIAYSPDTDIVRKYWFQGDRNSFRLIDEDGNLLSFWRVD